jgi:hypothetical protein
MGLIVAALSVTGVVIWHRKRLARAAVRRREQHVAARTASSFDRLRMRL